MNLYLTSIYPLDARYTNQHGQTIYVANTPNKIWRRVTSIRKIVPNEHSGDDSADMKDKFEDLATIEWHRRQADITLPKEVSGYHLERFSTKDYMRKGNLTRYGWNHIFTAPDGKEYKWRLGASVSSLILNTTSEDPNPTIIAKYHKKKYGVLTNERRDAYLEIRPEGEHMVDLILVTFIFAEKRRKDSEG